MGEYQVIDAEGHIVLTEQVIDQIIAEPLRDKVQQAA